MFWSSDRSIAHDMKEPLDDRRQPQLITDKILKYRFHIFTALTAGSLAYGIYWNYGQSNFKRYLKRIKYSAFFTSDGAWDAFCFGRVVCHSSYVPKPCSLRLTSVSIIGKFSFFARPAGEIALLL